MFNSLRGEQRERRKEREKEKERERERERERELVPLDREIGRQVPVPIDHQKKEGM
jgi:hypothetical protein